jgi:acyl-CoA synthetase (NDP forming)
MNAISQPRHANRSVGMGRLLRPRSVVIVGMSSRPGSAGHAVLKNLLINDFAGDIHLLGRTPGKVEGHSVVTSFDMLPDGIDVAVIALPAAGVAEALQSCVDHKIGAAIVFASGFAEAGEAARSEQDRLARTIAGTDLLVLGPNCIGYANYLEGFAVAFATVNRVPNIGRETVGAVAIVSQSGGLANHIRLGLEVRDIAVAYNISTGNEMDLGLADFIDYLVANKATRAIVVYAEHIRAPYEFLTAVARARDAGKPVVMLHPGRGSRAQEATKSHTGSLAGDYTIMKLKVERAGVVLVESLDELVDCAELLLRFPTAVSGGLGIVTFSGAFCGVAHDFCESIGTEIPQLSAATVEHLRPQLPPFISPSNPLDLGTQPIWQPELVGIGVRALLEDTSVGGVIASLPSGDPAKLLNYLEQIIAARNESDKPITLAVLGDGSPLRPDIVQTARDHKIVFTRSSDRLMRAMAHVVRRRSINGPVDITSDALDDPDLLVEGVQTEWRAKAFLAKIGLRVPHGRLVETVEDALSTADEIGFPVALKAQASSLAHKTEAGGVILNLATEQALREGWTRLHTNIERAKLRPTLEGVLVEAMAPPGVELVVGARRDAQWGPVVLIGLGGIFVEALRDVRLIAPESTRAEIIAEFRKLKGAKLLEGFRNLPEVDLDAAAATVETIARLISRQTSIKEIEINPLMAHAKGRGATVLDALIVTA